MSPSKESIAVMIRARQGIKDELADRPEQGGHPALPSLDQVLDGLGPLPPGALFLGMAEDDLPVLLDLFDPSPGPLLVAGGPASGKTRFLRHLACAAAALFQPRELQFGVVSRTPAEWDDLRGLRNCVGIFSPDGAEDFLVSLSGWAHSRRANRQVVLLLWDGLESAAALDPSARDTLAWLLDHGPERRVWTVATVDPGQAAPVHELAERFPTRLFGRWEGTQAPDEALSGLLAGIQFALQEGSRWVRFWIPDIAV